MSTTTSKYGLVKPALTDVPDITAMNPNWDTIDSQLAINNTIYASSSADDSYAISVTGITSQANLLGIVLKFTTTVPNTTACTLNVNGYGAKAICKDVSMPLETGDIIAGNLVTVVWDGTRYQLLEMNGVVTKNGTQVLTNKILTAPKMTSASSINDANGNELIKFPVAVANSLNEITISNATTGNAPIIQASGSDTNVALDIKSKGAGLIRHYINNAISVVFDTVANAVNYLTIKANTTTNAPQIIAIGTDSNIGIDIIPKGMGIVNIPTGVTFGKRGEGAIGENSFSSGSGNISSGVGSHSEGKTTIAKGDGAHAEGESTKAYGYNSHAEGFYTQAGGSSSDPNIGYNAHAEGLATLATGNNSHAEGIRTQASGDHSHAEGRDNTATNDGAHVGGAFSSANGTESFAHGVGLQANGNQQTIFGRYNTPNTYDLFQIGMGSSGNDRKNAFVIDGSGNVFVSGSIIEYPMNYESSNDSAISDLLNNFAAFVASNGKYSFTITLGIAYSGWGMGGVWLIEGYVSNSTYETQLATSYANGFSMKARAKVNGGWTAWKTIA